MVTRSTSFGPTAGVADTETTIGSAYSFGKSGRIYEIRVTGYGGVTDKAQNGILLLYFKNLAGPFEWSVYGVGNEVTVSGARQTEVIPCDIPYTVGEQVTIKYKGAEASEEVTVSLSLQE